MILKTGLEFVRANGYPPLRCETIAELAKCGKNTVRRHFANRVKLAEGIRDYAKEVGDMAAFEAGQRVTGQ